MLTFFNFLKRKNGFTLVEVLTAIFVILVGVVGTMATIQQTLAYTSLSASRLVASYLAQEGIEIVRNFRDGNWLEQRTNPPLPWTNGLSSGDWEVDYNDTVLTAYVGAGRYLKIDGGFYNYESGTNTKFKRKITIVQDSDGGNPCLKVSVLVEWQQVGKTHQVTAQEYLYNWR